MCVCVCVCVCAPVCACRWTDNSLSNKPTAILEPRTWLRASLSPIPSRQDSPRPGLLCQSVANNVIVFCAEAKRPLPRTNEPTDERHTYYSIVKQAISFLLKQMKIKRRRRRKKGAMYISLDLTVEQICWSTRRQDLVTTDVEKDATVDLVAIFLAWASYMLCLQR